MKTNVQNYVNDLIYSELISRNESLKARFIKNLEHESLAIKYIFEGLYQEKLVLKHGLIITNELKTEVFQAIKKEVLK